MNAIKHFSLVAAAAVLTFGCVDHRPVRNGLENESVYLDKATLTAANPKYAADDPTRDDGWLFKTTVVKTSAPNVLADVIFPGLESDLKYVKFRYQEDALQVLDAQTIQYDDPDDPNDDLATMSDRVIFEFTGHHVDVKLRESLDGERTNYLEENTEEDWQVRQKFKVDFEETSIEPANMLLWVYGLYANMCAVPISTHLVPDSFEWDEKEQYLSFVLDVSYQINWNGWICSELLNLYELDAHTSNVQYRFAFWRPGPSEYEPMRVAEKDAVNKKYGFFQTYGLFRDSISGLQSSVDYMNRWDPKRTEPVTYYFHEGYPEKWKPMWDEIMALTNKTMEEAGATVRFQVKEWNDGGVERHFGDPRYSFIVWHHGIDQTSGLLGYGPSIAHPNTGEILSGSVNLYNIGMDYYRFMIQHYLETRGGLLKPDAEKPWEQIECAEGATVAPADPIRCEVVGRDAKAECLTDGGTEETCAPAGEQAKTECLASPRLTAQLFVEMARVMEADATFTGNTGDFVPTPARADFRKDYRKILPELRYAYPGYNRYVYHGTDQPAAELVALTEQEQAFKRSMKDVMAGENPFGTTPLHSHDGIERQLAFAESMRSFRKSHNELTALHKLIRGRKCVYSVDPADAVTAISMNARQCVARDGGKATWESDDEYRERIVEALMFQTAIHEFGHTLSLRHNFYGSVDEKYQGEGRLTSTVMEYLSPVEDATHGRDWGQYDKLALSWLYGTDAARAKAEAEDPLYCTDEHEALSPLCRTFDLGITPAQIVLNAIERYDWQYDLRNRRAYRTFWDTSSYVDRVYGAIYDLQRMWHLAIFDWGGGGVQDLLRRVDQTSGGEVLSTQEYDEIATDFYNDASAANAMMMAFYDAVINQSATFRNYQTEYDPFYGDILRLGIIVDKLFATFAFMDLQDVYYSPNVQTYAAVWDAPAYGEANEALAQRVLDNMLGSNYDTFPWFKYYALMIFGSVTNSDLVDNIEMKERIAIERYDNAMELYEIYPEEQIALASREDNPQQTFVHGGEEFVYTYLPDRNWHLVARKSRSPVSYQFMREYNEKLNAGADEDEDNYGLKILLAYHEYFNNFVGF